MIRSLRWRLQLWHALLLTTVLFIFGGFVHALQWQTRLQQTDAELDRMASVLMSRLRGLFPVPRMPVPGSWPSRTPGRGPGSPRSNESRPGEASALEDSALIVADAMLPANVMPLPSRDSDFASRESSADDSNDARRREGRGSQRSGSRDGNGRDPTRDGSPDRSQDKTRESKREGTEDRRRDSSRDPAGLSPWFNPPPGLGLPDEFKQLFEGDGAGSYYFTIWDRNGTVLERSKSVGEVPFPDLHTSGDGLPVRTVRMRDAHREVVHVSRFDINVLVGRSLGPDLAAQQRSGFMLVLTGLGVLAIGLAGGWWFSSRAIRPIAEMSKIAESISVRNLSTRINVDSTAAELEQLATVLNRTFDRLQSAFERQGQFTADASHELRTPLSVILSHAELALSRPRSNEEYQKALQACRRASLRMKTLIDSLLLLARFDSGKSEIEPRAVEVDRVAQDAVELLQPLADERQVSLHCHAGPITIDADQERLFQLLTNLLSNAIRYNRAQGRVDLEITEDEQSAIIRVTDTGVGIPPEDLPRIFDRFYRVDKARSNAEGGSGLGLAICHTIVETHRGTISATSNPGHGTCIEVRLPLRGDAAIADSNSADVECPKSGTMAVSSSTG